MFAMSEQLERRRNVEHAIDGYLNIVQQNNEQGDSKSVTPPPSCVLYEQLEP